MAAAFSEYVVKPYRMEVYASQQLLKRSVQGLTGFYNVLCRRQEAPCHFNKAFTGLCKLLIASLYGLHKAYDGSLRPPDALHQDA